MADVEFVPELVGVDLGDELGRVDVCDHVVFAASHVVDGGFEARDIVGEALHVFEGLQVGFDVEVFGEAADGVPLGFENDLFGCLVDVRVAFFGFLLQQRLPGFGLLNLDGGEVAVHAVGGGAEFVDSVRVDVVYVAGDFVVFAGECGGALPVRLEFWGGEVSVFADGQDNAHDDYDDDDAEDDVPEGEGEAYGEEDAEPFEGGFHGCSFAIRRCICECRFPPLGYRRWVRLTKPTRRSQQKIEKATAPSPSSSLCRYRAHKPCPY